MAELSASKIVALIASGAGMVVAVAGALKVLDMVPATQRWTTDYTAPLRANSITLLRVQRQLDAAELFQWESNAVMTPDIHSNIERLKQEIAEIDRQLLEQHTGMK